MAFCAWCGNHVAEVSYAACPRCGNPTNGSQRPAGGGNGGSAGIVIGVIVGGIVLVAVIGIIAAIAIPNLIAAKERASQKRTMADMRSIATAVEAYGTDNDIYPEATSAAELQSALSPKYLSTVPAADAWGTAFRYECWPRGECRNYALASAGKDKLFEHGSLQDYAEETPTTNYEADLVYANGRFAQYPQGAQR